MTMTRDEVLDIVDAYVTNYTANLRTANLEARLSALGAKTALIPDILAYYGIYDGCVEDMSDAEYEKATGAAIDKIVSTLCAA